MYLGIDGCRAGWLVAKIDDRGKLNLQILSRLNEIARLSFPILREAHPELCFLGWSGSPCKHNKKTPEGIAERREMVYYKNRG